jgi:hypothetical protein
MMHNTYDKMFSDFFLRPFFLSLAPLSTGINIKAPELRTKRIGRVWKSFHGNEIL